MPVSSFLRPLSYFIRLEDGLEKDTEAGRVFSLDYEAVSAARQKRAQAEREARASEEAASAESSCDELEELVDAAEQPQSSVQMFACDFMCGYSGPYDSVVMHEQLCLMKPTPIAVIPDTLLHHPVASALQTLSVLTASIERTGIVGSLEQPNTGGPAEIAAQKFAIITAGMAALDTTGSVATQLQHLADITASIAQIDAAAGASATEA